MTASIIKPAIPTKSRIISAQSGRLAGAKSAHREKPVIYKNARAPKISKNSAGGNFMEPTRGLEPRTYGLRYRCSAIELGRHFKIYKYLRGDVQLQGYTALGRFSTQK